MNHGERDDRDIPAISPLKETYDQEHLLSPNTTFPSRLPRLVILVLMQSKRHQGSSAVLCLSPTPSGGFVSGGADGEVRLWDESFNVKELPVTIPKVKYRPHEHGSISSASKTSREKLRPQPPGKTSIPSFCWQYLSLILFCTASCHDSIP